MPTHFRTIVTPPRPSFSVTHSDRLVSVGSCFSEHIGRYFERYKFDVDINPFGQQYNPASISNALNRLISGQEYTETDLIYQDELYHSYDHHGDFSVGTMTDALSGINERLADSSKRLRQANCLFLTFGTAHVFKLKSSGKIVSNCHKVPGSQFDFSLMVPDEIVACLSDSLESLWKINPSVKVVLTVSPVRYFAFGHFENSVSKGHLFAAIHALMLKYPQLYYFPAYEIVMDDLRDYRFFADDMLHPTHQAVAYVWEKLATDLLSADTQNILKELDDIASAVNHRPRNPNSEAHRKFKESYLTKMKMMEEKYGFDLNTEIKQMF